VGSRQNRRDRGTNVIDVDYDREAIYNAVMKQAANTARQPSFIYGGGDAGKQIADLLYSLPIKFHKTIAY
jgi:hypothetical protein